MTDNEKRAARISIHWRPGELERIQRAGELLGLPLADFLRMAGLERARAVIEQAGRNPWAKEVDGAKGAGAEGREKG